MRHCAPHRMQPATMPTVPTNSEHKHEVRCPNHDPALEIPPATGCCVEPFANPWALHSTVDDSMPRASRALSRFSGPAGSPFSCARPRGLSVAGCIRVRIVGMAAGHAMEGGRDMAAGMAGLAGVARVHRHQAPRLVVRHRAQAGPAGVEDDPVETRFLAHMPPRLLFRAPRAARHVPDPEVLDDDPVGAVGDCSRDLVAPGAPDARLAPPHLRQTGAAALPKPGPALLPRQPRKTGSARLQLHAGDDGNAVEAPPSSAAPTGTASAPSPGRQRRATGPPAAKRRSAPGGRQYATAAGSPVAGQDDASCPACAAQGGKRPGGGKPQNNHNRKNNPTGKERPELWRDNLGEIRASIRMRFPAAAARG